MTTVRQFGFSFGQIGKIGYARVDQNFYALGLRQLKNGIVERAGIASVRTGTVFADETHDSTKRSRLIPFIFSPDPDQAYALEFTDLRMRVYRNRQLVTEASKNITGATQANPCELTVVAHGYATGDHVIVARGSVVGMKQLNGRQYKVVNTGANTFTLTRLDGTAINSIGFAAYVSGGTVARVYSITTPYVEADLAELYFTQSADVMTIVHQNYAPRELARTGHAAWTLSTIVFGPTTPRPGMHADGTRTLEQFVSSGGIGGGTTKYIATAVSETGEESFAGLGGDLGARGITNITQANPAVVTFVVGAAYEAGDIIFITGVGGMVQVNNKFFKIANPTATTLELEGIDSTGYGAYTVGGLVQALYSYSAVEATPANPKYLQVGVDDLDEIDEVRIYRQSDGAGSYGLIGSATKWIQAIGCRIFTFTDVGNDADGSSQPPIEKAVFDAAGRWPAVVTYYQQRKAYADTGDEPETFRASRIASYDNFAATFPTEDDNPVTGRVPGSQVNEIKHLVDIQKLVILTTGCEMVANGDAAGALTPTSVNIRTVSYNGASGVRPVLVDNVLVFIQERGAMLLGIAFNSLDRYDTYDLSLPSIDLLEGHTIVDMAYQKAPNSIIWLLRDDGVLLSFTFVPQQEIRGWAIHETDGLVESLCCIPEADQTALYMVVNRNGLRYVEVLARQLVTDIVDYVGMDSCRTYDGRHRNDGVNVRIEGGVTWLAGEDMTVRASSGTPFHADDVGSAVFVRGDLATHGVDILIRCTITAYLTATTVKVRTNYDVPAGLRTVYTVNWDLAALTIYELWHLEGKELSVLRDGGVYASPNNDTVETVATVTNGKITLDEPGGVVAAGLPFLPAIETLNIDTVQGEPLIGKMKEVKSVHVFVKDTRSIWAGPNPPSDNEVDPLEGLDEHVPANVDDAVDQPPPLTTDVVRIRLQSRWNSNGRVFITTPDPLPLTILAIAPSGVIPLRG